MRDVILCKNVYLHEEIDFEDIFRVSSYQIDTALGANPTRRKNDKNRRLKFQRLQGTRFFALRFALFEIPTSVRIYTKNAPHFSKFRVNIHFTELCRRSRGLTSRIMPPRPAPQRPGAAVRRGNRR